MANIKNIDDRFIQVGPACVLVSYSTIINYFSNGALSIDDVLNKYADYVGINISLSKGEKETEINKHYHSYCVPRKMRGFDYLADIVHNGDIIGTKQYCKIIDRKTDLNPISISAKLNLKESLKKSDRIAMVLSPMQSSMHARVVGWNDDTQLYFIKDPNNAIPFISDFLCGNDVYEYLLFERI